MSEERKAGELILSQLGMFNEAVVLFENVISPAVLKGIDECVESFAEAEGWNGTYELSSADDCWLTPKSWAIDSGEEIPSHKAWFVIDCINAENDYWQAIFCGLGTENGEAGFSFEVAAKAFGGKNAWNAYAKSIPQELISKLANLGFRNLDKGRFFLPVRLDNMQLAKSWLEFGEFTSDDDSFKPLREAMDKLKDAVPLFEQIMQACPGASANPA